MDWDSLNAENLFGDFGSLDDAVEAALNESSAAQLSHSNTINNANNNINTVQNNNQHQYQQNNTTTSQYDSHSADYTLGSEAETPQQDYFQQVHTESSSNSLPSEYSIDASDVSVYGFAPVHNDPSSQSQSHTEDQYQTMNNTQTMNMSNNQTMSNTVQSQTMSISQPTAQYDTQSTVQSQQVNGQYGQSQHQPTVQAQAVHSVQYNGQSQHHPTVQVDTQSMSDGGQYNGQSQTIDQPMSNNVQYGAQSTSQTQAQTQSSQYNNGQSRPMSTAQPSVQPTSVQYDNSQLQTVQSQSQTTVQYDQTMPQGQSTGQCSTLSHTDFSGIFSPSHYLQPEPQPYPCTSFQAPQQLNFEPQLDGVEFLPDVTNMDDLLQSHHQQTMPAQNHTVMQAPSQSQNMSHSQQSVQSQSQNMNQTMVQSHSQQSQLQQSQQSQLQVPVQNQTMVQQSSVQSQSQLQSQPQGMPQSMASVQTHSSQNQSQLQQSSVQSSGQSQGQSLFQSHSTLQLPPQSAHTLVQPTQSAQGMNQQSVQVVPQTMAQRRQRKRQSRKQAASKKQTQRKGMVPVDLQTKTVQTIQPQSQPVVQHETQPQSMSMVPSQQSVHQSVQPMSQPMSQFQFPVDSIVQLQLPDGLHLPQMNQHISQLSHVEPLHHPLALPQVYPPIASNRPWRTQAFRTWYSTQTQQKLEPATAEELEICQQLEKAVAAQQQRQDDQMRTVRDLDHLEGLNLKKFDAQNEYTDGVPEMVQIYHCEKEFKEKDEDTQARERLIMNMQALDMRTHMMLYELNFSSKTHFHRNRVCDHTCSGSAPPTTLTKYSRPKAHPMILPEQAIRWRHRTILVRDLFYSCKDHHQQRVQMLISYLEEDFMKIRVTSERAKQILINKYKNPYLPLFDHLARQVMPNYECPELFQYLLSAMPNVYLSAYYRVEGKQKKKVTEDGVYHPDEKDVGERYCGICDKWFKTRNHNWASHMTSAHGICSATKSIYPFPLAVILGFPSLTQKEDELIKIQELKFKPNSHGDMHIVNDNRPQHHLLPDKEIKLSGLCSVCWHYIPLYTKRGATVWTTWFRHQDKHIRQMNQERQGGVGINKNNPRNNKRRRGEISEEVRLAWEAKNGIKAKKRKIDEEDMSFLEEEVVIEGDPQWLSEEFEVFSQ